MLTLTKNRGWGAVAALAVPNLPSARSAFGRGIVPGHPPHLRGPGVWFGGPRSQRSSCGVLLSRASSKTGAEGVNVALRPSARHPLTLLQCSLAQTWTQVQIGRAHV